MDITSLFQAFEVAKVLAAYLGIVETIDGKIDRLSQSEFDAGLRALKQAKNSDLEMKPLLREARARFNKAISIEQWERLALAHLGLAICHFHLGDKKNSTEELTLLRDLNFNKVDFLDYLDLLHRSIPILPYSFIFSAINKYRRKIREKKLEKILLLQQKIKEYLDQTTY